MEALPAKDYKSALFYTYKLRPGITNIDDYGLTLARDVKMPEHLIEHAIQIEKCLRQRKTVSNTNYGNETCNLFINLKTDITMYDYIIIHIIQTSITFFISIDITG